MPKGSLFITPVGHATCLIQLDGLNILTDPNELRAVLAERGLKPDAFMTPPPGQPIDLTVRSGNGDRLANLRKANAFWKKKCNGLANDFVGEVHNVNRPHGGR